ncbi:MAG: ABC transporter permease [Flavobacteriaceae bacterium]|nr:ABC transporter permease [Flavobacteriaceae bacterium]
MNFTLYIAKRYLFTKSSNNAINFITIIAAIGVIIGSAALLIVLSGFAGLKDYSLQFSSFVDPDLKVLPVEGKSFELTAENIQKINSIENIASYSKIIEERAVLEFDNKRQIITLKGVDEHYPEHTINSIVSLGSWFLPDANQIVSGWGIASNLSFGVMDYGKVIKIYTPKPGKGQITSEKDAFNTITTTNIGIFEINEQLDNSIVYCDIELARELLNYNESAISSLEFKLSDIDHIEKVIEALQAALGSGFQIKTKEQLNDALHKMLNTENLAVYLIFTLVLIIALFNVIGSIIMMILDKKNDLKTLFNLGVTVKEIQGVFLLHGSLMVVLGGLVGILLAILLVIIQQIFGFVMITTTLPYPVALKFTDVVLVFFTITILGFLAAKIASTRISKSLLAQ